MPLKQQDPEFVRSTFAGIAGRYDLANHVLSGGMDFLWRFRAARIVAATRPSRVLDLATGSGDLAAELRRRCEGAEVVGADFCLPMLEVAAAKGHSPLVQADALHLPFRDGGFDALTVSFGLRNMASWSAALKEMGRVLKPGGLVLVMDFSLPTNPLLRNPYRLYLHRVLPVMAGWLTGKPEAYAYLGESIEKFPSGRAMTELITSCGFSDVRHRALAFGIAAIHTGTRVLEDGTG